VHPFSSTDGYVTTVDPATGLDLARHDLWTGEQVEAALDRASQRWPGWRSMPLYERIAAVARAADAIEAAADPMAAILTAEMGRPTAPARAEIVNSVFIAATSSTCSLRNHSMNCSPSTSPSDRAARKSASICVVTVFS